MPAFPRKKPLVRCHVALLGADRAAVRWEPAPGRWPAEGPPDRLRTALGLAAWALHRGPEQHDEALRAALRRAAEGLAVPDGRVEAVRLVEQDGPRSGAVVADLEGSAVGPVTVLRRAPRSPAGLGIAALAVLAATAGSTDADGRLAIALGVEGVLAWYREAHRMTPPRDAVRSALVHAADRLAAAGRRPPADLPV